MKPSRAMRTANITDGARNHPGFNASYTGNTETLKRYFYKRDLHCLSKLKRNLDKKENTVTIFLEHYNLTPLDMFNRLSQAKRKNLLVYNGPNIFYLPSRCTVQ